jgi:hypothetical protein
MIRAAFDIETVSPMIPDDERPEFGNPRHFELQSAGIAIEEDGEVTDVQHLTRDGWGDEHELALIEDIIDTLEAANPDVTYTYNGSDFDLFLMDERSRLCAGGTNYLGPYKRMEDFESQIAHEDLKEDAWSAFGNYTTLEEALIASGVFEDENELPQTLIPEFDHGIDHTTWAWKNPDSDDVDVLESGDVAVIGEHYLDGLEDGRDDEQFQQLQEMLDHYVRNDVEYLFDLADARPY